MNIKSIIATLELSKKDAEVYFDFCSCVPTKVDSWRGVYAEPSIGWSATGHTRNGNFITVEELIKELKHSISGTVYTGWKGGEFTYSENNTLHVDNPGDYTDTEITYIEDREYCVILHTQSVCN